MGVAFKVDARVVAFGDGRAVLFTVGFGEPADNPAIVRDAAAALESVLAAENGGSLALINGPASLPVMAVLAHKLGHRFDAVAVWDPKIDAYVVAIAHGPRFALGQTIVLEDGS